MKYNTELNEEKNNENTKEIKSAERAIRNR